MIEVFFFKPKQSSLSSWQANVASKLWLLSLTNFFCINTQLYRSIVVFVITKQVYLMHAQLNLKVLKVARIVLL